jgi:DNA-binding XRE family transcriptional regulator
MNDLEAVKDNLLLNMPNIHFEYDPSDNEAGSSWLDLQLDDQFINIEWKPNKGFGLYLGDDDSYGVGPNEVYRSAEPLVKRVSMLFREHKLNLKLKEIREILGVSQKELAELLGKQQGSISKIESRERDVLLKTLCTVINALGGKLEIKAHFDDFDVPLDFSCLNNQDDKSITTK